jgi:hypothetical protein
LTWKFDSYQDLRDFLKSVRDEARTKGAPELAEALDEVATSPYTTPGEFLNEAALVLEKAKRYLRWRYFWRSRQGLDQALTAVHDAFLRKR